MDDATDDDANKNKDMDKADAGDVDTSAPAFLWEREPNDHPYVAEAEQTTMWDDDDLPF